MLRQNCSLSIIFLGLIVLAPAVIAQTYPNKPIRVLVSEAGSNLDVTLRRIAPDMTSALGQPVIVDNRPASRNSELLSKATPDGYTLILTASTLWIAPLLQAVSYDPVKDFSPIALVTAAPLIVVVHPSVPVKSIAELVALAKARSGVLNYGSGGVGGSGQLGSELFKSMAGVNIVQVPFKGAGPALTALVSGEVQLMFNAAGSAMPLVKTGRLRALAVTSLQPSALLPGLPTVSAAVPGYEFVSLAGVMAPAKTPPAVINKLNQEIVRILNKSDVKDAFFETGVEVVASSPQQFAATMKSEMDRLGKVIKDAGIRAE